jgi:hypothetical protein
MMPSVALFVARSAVTAWVGAALLFVVVGVNEVVHGGFSSEIRDQLVVIRFPWFYRFGFGLIGAALLGTLCAAGHDEMPARRRWVAAGLLFAAVAVMTAEYFAVYLRLAALVTPPGKPRTVEFMTYHRASMWVNFADLALCLLAAGLLNWPARRAGGASQLDSASATSVR